MRTNDIAIPAVCAVAGAAIGFIGGFIFAKAKYKKLYEDKYDKEVFELKKKNMKSEIEGEKVDDEKAKEIAKDFPSELWTEQFKKDNEKRKEYKNIVRKEQYFEDDNGEVDKSEVFDEKKFDKENKTKQETELEEDIQRYSEYAGISVEELKKGSVRIISDDEYYETEHKDDPVELQWSTMGGILRNEDGEILEPSITFGEDWDEIVRRIETREEETFVYDERLDRYYMVSIENPRNVK